MSEAQRLEVMQDGTAVRQIEHPVDTQPHGVAALCQLGLEKCKLGDTNAALALLERAMALAPGAARVWSVSAHILRQAGRDGLAEACVRRACALAPAEGDYHLQLAELLDHAGRVNDAATALRDGLLACRDARLHVRLGLVLEASGASDEAEAQYRAALRVDPRSAEAHNNLGLLFMAKDRVAQAREHFASALAARPGFAEAHYNIGIVHGKEGDLVAAEQAYLRALSIRPTYPDALNNLGNLHRMAGRTEQAERYLRACIAADPGFMLGYRNLIGLLSGLGRTDEVGMVLQEALRQHPASHDLLLMYCLYQYEMKRLDAAENVLRTLLAQHPASVDGLCAAAMVHRAQGRWDAVARAMRAVVRLRPDHAPHWNDLAVSLKECGKLEQAEGCLRRAIALDANCLDAINNLALLCRQNSGRIHEAERLLRVALRAHPESLETLNHLGLVLLDSQRLTEAVALLEHAARRHPQSAETLCNLGTAYLDSGRAQEAASLFESAGRLKPGLLVARWNLSLSMLLLGRFPEGWAGYEARLEVDAPPESRVQFPQTSLPRWKGESLAGKRLLVVGEQGFGDQIQFLRYITPLSHLAKRVDVMVRPELARLARTVAGIGTVFCTMPEDQHDCFVMMMSIPGIVGTDERNIPNASPYLAVDAARRTHWGQRLNALAHGRLKVGVAWAGSPAHPNDRNRSIDVALFRDLFGIAGVAWFMLHKAHDRAAIEAGPAYNFGSEVLDFSDTAAIVEGLDLVISVDTAAAHLAGALGKPTWVLLPVNPDWRWQLVREDSPWYPSLRLFRQVSPGEWKAPLAQVAQALCAVVAASARDGEPATAV